MNRALALLEPAAAEFADLREPGVAALHGQLARALMIQGLDDRVGVAVADRALEVAEQLELTDVVADAMVTKGMGLINLGRGNEGLGLVTAALDLARAHKLAATEARALGNLSVTVGARHVGDGPRLTHELIELERRQGVRSGLTMMNATEVARWAGEWDWADELKSELLASDLEGVDHLFAVGVDVIFKAARGELRGGEQEELDRLAAELDDPAALVIAVGVRPEMYLYAGHLREALVEAESQARTDLLNATVFLDIAGHAALWDGDLESLKRVHRELEEMGGRGPLVAAQRRAMQAGIDGLEGRRTDALAASARRSASSTTTAPSSTVCTRRSTWRLPSDRPSPRPDPRSTAPARPSSASGRRPCSTASTPSRNSPQARRPRTRRQSRGEGERRLLGLHHLGERFRKDRLRHCQAQIRVGGNEICAAAPDCHAAVTDAKGGHEHDAVGQLLHRQLVHRRRQAELPLEVIGG